METQSRETKLTYSWDNLDFHLFGDSCSLEGDAHALRMI